MNQFASILIIIITAVAVFGAIPIIVSTASKLNKESTQTQQVQSFDDVVKGTHIGTIDGENITNPNTTATDYFKKNPDKDLVIIKSSITSEYNSKPNKKTEESYYSPDIIQHFVFAKDQKMQKAINTVTANFDKQKWPESLNKYKGNFLVTYLNNGGVATKDRAAEIMKMKTVPFPQTPTTATTKEKEDLKAPVVKTYTETLDEALKAVVSKKIAVLSDNPLQGELVYKEQVPHELRLITIDKENLHGQSADTLADALMTSAAEVKNGQSMNEFNTLILLVKDGNKDDMIVKSVMPKVAENITKVVESGKGKNNEEKLLLSNQKWVKIQSDANAKVKEDNKKADMLKTIEEQNNSTSTVDTNAANLVNVAVDGIGKYEVYKTTDSYLQYSKEIGDMTSSGTKIVVVTKDQASGRSANVLARQIYTKANSSSIKGIIVVVNDKTGNDAIGGYSPNGGLVKPILPDEIQNKDTIVEDAGQYFVNNTVWVEYINGAIQSNKDAQHAHDTGNAMKIIGGIGGAVFLGGTGYGIYAYRKRRKEALAKSVKGLMAKSGKDLAETAEKLEEVYALHEKLKPEDSLSDLILVLASNMNELNEAATQKGVMESQRQFIEIEYADRINKMIQLLDKDYYVDIVKNPNHWTDVIKRRVNVRKALERLNESVITTIQKLNDDREIDFKVAMRVLLDGYDESIDNDDQDIHQEPAKKENSHNFMPDFSSKLPGKNYFNNRKNPEEVSK